MGRTKGMKYHFIKDYVGKSVLTYCGIRFHSWKSFLKSLNDAMASGKEGYECKVCSRAIEKKDKLLNTRASHS